MTVPESAEPTKPQDGTKDDGKKPVEVKDEDLVRYRKCDEGHRC